MNYQEIFFYIKNNSVVDENFSEKINGFNVNVKMQKLLEKIRKQIINSKNLIDKDKNIKQLFELINLIK